MPVYFMRSGDDGPIRIGYSARPALRVMKVRSDCPTPVTILAVQEGGKDLETALQGRFAAHRVNGHWFAPTPELLSHVEALPPWSPEPRRRRAWGTGFGAWIAASGRTQEEVAEDLGVTQQAISAWVTGARRPKIPMLRRIKAYTGGEVREADFDLPFVLADDAAAVEAVA